eukprot:8071980-Pyramimonas_sp.AAC.1
MREFCGSSRRRPTRKELGGPGITTARTTRSASAPRGQRRATTAGSRAASRARTHLPLARWGDGSPITRERIQGLLQKAAALEGYPPDRFKSRSLRIGGATALCHCFQDTELVKRWG